MFFKEREHEQYNLNIPLASSNDARRPFLSMHLSFLRSGLGVGSQEGSLADREGPLKGRSGEAWGDIMIA